MEKPENFTYYSVNIPFKDWPQECKLYKSWRRDILNHPEWKDLSNEEYFKAKKESKRQRGINAAKAMRQKYQDMTTEEKAEINKKKGSHYNNLSDEEKKKRNDELSQISKDFWSSMTIDERREFGQYRWNLKSDKEKQRIIDQFRNGNMEWRDSLSQDDINNQIQKMNEARIRKMEEDEEFRLKQFELLRKHCKEFFNSLSDKEIEEFYKENGKRLGKIIKDKWENDPEYRKKQTEFLRLHSADYVNSLSEEELANRMKKLNELAVERTKYLWLNDEEYRRKMRQHGINNFKKYYSNLTPEELELHYKKLNEARIRYIESLTAEELNELLHYNKLNKRFEDQFNNSILVNSYYYRRELGIKKYNSLKLWDYGIFDKDGKLVMVVDLDGSYYHADKCDYDGLRSNENTDERRSYFISDLNNVYIVIISEINFIDGFKEMIKILLSNYDDYIDNLFNEYRSISFPYPKYRHKDIVNSFKQLINLNVRDNKYLALSTRNREGDRIINHFHHSIWHAHTKNNISPYDAWYDDKLLRKCIENRILYRSTLNPNKILQGFNISKIATKVSVFSAGRAKLLIYKYLNEYNEIFDPFSGFSGRMLGTMSLGKHYIGQDISDIHISEGIKLIDFLYKCKNNFPELILPSISCKDIFDSYGEYECLFTCPPYSDKEIWKGEIKDNKSCDEWIDICIKHFRCKKYLFVVDNTNKYQDNIVDIIINKSHFSKNNEYVILINGED